MLFGVWHYIFIHDVRLYLYVKRHSFELAICQIDGIPLSEIPPGVKGYPVGESSAIGEGAGEFDGVVA
jgi:hypothetical protein